MRTPSSPLQKATITPDVVLCSYRVSGAITIEVTSAYRRQDGKLLWTQTGELSGADKGEVVLVSRFAQFDPTLHFLVTTSRIAAKTGKVLDQDRSRESAH